MENTKIFKAAKKAFHYSPVDILEVLFEQPENEWFTPVNRPDDYDYAIACSDLHFAGLICKKIIPKWVDGRYKGSRVYFLYNKNLDYK